MPAYIVNQETGEVATLSIAEFEDTDLERTAHFNRRWKGWKWAVSMTIDEWITLLNKLRKDQT